MDAGRFRADLFYRINVVRLRLPRLRERREDIPVLAEYFRALYERQFGKESDQLSAEMFDYLQNLSWPGNVRELSNGIARYVLIGPEAVIPEEQPQKRTSVIFGTSLDGGPASLKSLAKEAIREMERNVILETLRANHWNRRKTAQALKISYRALIYKIRDAGLISGRSRVASASRS
jgi:DNA-binding NtrC family response regulator